MAQRTKTRNDCHSIAGLLAVPADRFMEARDVNGANRSRRVSGLLRGVGAKAVGAAIAFFEVEDTHREAARLNAANIPASPVHAVGFQGHTKAMSGTQPDLAQISFPNVPKGGELNVIAMVDSGIAGSLPSWMSVINDDVDVEVPDKSYSTPASHGTFVASVLRQISPDHVVSLAAARPDRGQLDPVPTDDGNPTNELEVAAAIFRLIARHQKHPQRVKALNISIGAYACHPDSIPPNSHLLTMRIALEAWRRVFPEVPIFAAGGNSESPDPVYPAAWSDLGNIHAVAAGKARAEVVWDRPSPPQRPREVLPPKQRTWITDGAWGSDVLGLSGQDTSHAIRWSGSSFATAVATASYLKGESPKVVNGVQWWPETVGGLHHV